MNFKSHNEIFKILNKKIKIINKWFINDINKQT